MKAFVKDRAQVTHAHSFHVGIKFFVLISLSEKLLELKKKLVGDVPVCSHFLSLSLSFSFPTHSYFLSPLLPPLLSHGLCRIYFWSKNVFSIWKGFSRKSAEKLSRKEFSFYSGFLPYLSLSVYFSSIFLSFSLFSILNLSDKFLPFLFVAMF